MGDPEDSRTKPLATHPHPAITKVFCVIPSGHYENTSHCFDIQKLCKLLPLEKGTSNLRANPTRSKVIASPRPPWSTLVHSD
ncbi:hypothetical protein RUM44_012209 [Polyplax serrata]|uniref:Uncharacterized protein n=1 Tax=Polyplax serrata TaxID=468196 RepID=A0ABR1BEJ3_POLSC